MPRILLAIALASLALAPQAHAAKRLTDAQVVDRALELASMMGDDDPRTLTVVPAAHDDAVRVAMPGDEIGRDKSRVYALVLTGKFSRVEKDDDAAPTASVLTLVISPGEELLDWALGDTAPDLTPLGNPRRLASVSGDASGPLVRLARSGHTVASAKVSGGKFRVAVAPGTYRLTAGTCAKTVRVTRVKTRADCA
jgi:hypothetical protein